MDSHSNDSHGSSARGPFTLLYVGVCRLIGTPVVLSALGIYALSFGVRAIADFEPTPPELRFTLSEGTMELDEFGDPFVPGHVQDHITGTLQQLFGTPNNPRFMRTEAWLDDDYNPNYPQYAEDDNGSGEFSEEDLDAIYADNERHFRANLAKIDAGDYDAVILPRDAPDLSADWDLLLQDRADGVFESDEEFQEEARGVFALWYPSLRDSAELYRQQCMHCHGVNGDGKGETAEFLNPRPRNYQRGIFKFTAIQGNGARRADLYKLIEQGATGSAMPSFRRFSRAQIEGLVDYVRLLSMRGMVENDLVVRYTIDEEPLTPESSLEMYAETWDEWNTAHERYIAFDGEIPAPTPEGIERGRQIFLDDASQCGACHGEDARGNGAASWKPDENGELVSIQDDWGDEIRPRDLTRGIFRGGKRPIDVYHRIYTGVKGTPMAAFGESLEPQAMWDLIHYVYSLSENPWVVHDDGHGGGHGEEDSHGGDEESHGGEDSHESEGSDH